MGEAAAMSGRASIADDRDRQTLAGTGRRDRGGRETGRVLAGPGRSRDHRGRDTPEGRKTMTDQCNPLDAYRDQLPGRLLTLEVLMTLVSITA